MMNAGLGAIAPGNPMAAQPQPFQQLLALDEKVRAVNLARATQGEQAMAEAGQGFRTVKQELEMAYQQALGALAPQPAVPEMANGGLVAFQSGGSTFADTLGFGVTPEALALDEIRAAEARQQRQRREIKERYEFLKTSAPDTAARMLRENPWLEPGQPPAPLRGAPTSPRAVPASAGAPAGLAAAAGAAGARPPVARPPAPTPNVAPPQGAPAPGTDLTALRAAQEHLAGLVGERAGVSPEVLRAREEYDRTMREAISPAEQQLRELEAAQKRGIFSDPEALMEMLAGMGDKPMTFGQAVAGAGRGAMTARARQQTRVRDAQARLAQLRSELAREQAKERLARAEGDERAARESRLKQAELKVAMETQAIDIGFKGRQATVQERQVGASERQARAAETAAANRPTVEQRGALTENQRAMLMERAIDNVTKDPNTAAAIARAKAEAPKTRTPFDEASFRQQLIQRQYQALLAAAEGRTIAPTPGAAPGATTPTQGWGSVQEVPRP